MLCQKCHKNPATARYAEVIDGNVTHLQVCSACLALYQEGDGTGFELGGAAPAPQFAAAPVSRREAPELKVSCRGCGRNLKTILETAAVGCAGCYQTFSAHLEALLEGLHVALNHQGKVPHVDDDQVRVRAELQAKRSLLRTALGTENYEAAATLRDEIQMLELNLRGAGASHDSE